MNFAMIGWQPTLTDGWMMAQLVVFLAAEPAILKIPLQPGNTGELLVASSTARVIVTKQESIMGQTFFERYLENIKQYFLVKKADGRKSANNKLMVFLVGERRRFSHWWQTIHGNTTLGIITLFLVVVPLVLFLGSLNDRDFEDLKAGKIQLTCLNFETGARYAIDSKNIRTVSDLRLLRMSDNGCLLRENF